LAFATTFVVAESQWEGVSLHPIPEQYKGHYVYMSAFKTEQFLLLKCGVCYFQYSNLRRTEGDGNCCLWQGTGTQWNKCLVMHSSHIAETNDEGEGGEKKPSLEVAEKSGSDLPTAMLVS